ncbi:MAG: transglycosylase SLT domain-containing protein [Pseudomonadota bacterium]
MQNSLVFLLLLVVSLKASGDVLVNDHANVVISLADTARQKASVDALKAIALDADARAQSDSAPGLLKRSFNRLFSGRAEPLPEKQVAPNTVAVSTNNADMPWIKTHDRRNRKNASGHFDDHFRKNTKHYFGIGTDWRWFQAQAMVESEMKPAVRSRSGAMGLMQIMPRTFQEIRTRHPHLNDPFDPRLSIAAGIYYNRQLYEAWPHIDNEDDRRRFMFASYNAGLGNIKRAAKRAGNPDRYAVLEPALAPGPRHYLVKIERERRKLGD